METSLLARQILGQIWDIAKNLVRRSLMLQWLPLFLLHTVVSHDVTVTQQDAD